MKDQRQKYHRTISAYQIEVMNKMEKIFGRHDSMHDTLRQEFHEIVKNATSFENNPDGSITLYVNSYDERTALTRKINNWWSDIISWSSGND